MRKLFGLWVRIPFVIALSIRSRHGIQISCSEVKIEAKKRKERKIGRIRFLFSDCGHNSSYICKLSIDNEQSMNVEDMFRGLNFSNNTRARKSADTKETHFFSICPAWMLKTWAEYILHA